MIRVSHSVAVNEQSQVAEARRAAASCGASIPLSETTVGRASLAATELATNLIKHAGGGSLLFGVDDETASMVVVSIDRGPGLPHLDRAMRDGYSTAGSSGTGLGAIMRAAASFEVYSAPEKGTVITCRLDDEEPPRKNVPGAHSPLQIAGISLPIRGETECGDGWWAARDGAGARVAVIDGLGHGPQAAVAAAAALRVMHEQATASLADLLQDMHGALRATRGAAAGIADISPSRSTVEFTGVGNIAGTVIGESATRRTVSHAGIVGHEMRKSGSFTYPWSDDSLLVLHSDGLGSSWKLEDYPGLGMRDALIVAAVLYRDFCRGTDDVTVVVCRN